MWIGTWDEETETFGGNMLRLSSYSGLIMAEYDNVDAYISFSRYRYIIFARMNKNVFFIRLLH